MSAVDAMEGIDVSVCGDVTAEHLQGITLLDLSNMSIGALESGDFAGLTELRDLLLYSNSLTELPAGIFNGLNLTTLLLDRLAPTDLTAVDGSGQIVLAWIEPPISTAASITGYRIRSSMDGGSYTNLVTDTKRTATTYTHIGLSLRDTRYYQVAALTKEGTDTQAGPDSTTAKATVMFTSLLCPRARQVQDAIVMAINAIDGITVSNCAEVTRAHLRQVKVLNLSGLSITSLESRDLADLTSLTTLSLHSNGLTTLPADVFVDLTSLTELSLHSNSLTTLPANVFVGLTDLTELRDLLLYSNKLTTLPDNVFAGLTELRNLLLYSNKLTSLPDNVFAGLNRLETLLLYSNGLTTLPPGIFNNLSSLTTLSLSNNSLTMVPPGIFDDLNLEVLQLDRLAPTGLTGLTTTVGAGQIALSWTAPPIGRGTFRGANYATTITGYRIQVSTAGSAFTDLVANTGSADTTYTHTGLNLDDTHNYRVAALIMDSTNTQAGPYSAAADATVPASLTLPNPGAQIFMVGISVSVELPQATDDIGPYTYTLTGPNDAAVSATVPGLTFDPESRILSGAPVTAAAPVTLTYRVTGKFGTTAMQTFSVTVGLASARTPDASTNLIATPMGTQVALTWTAPSNNGGAAIIGYTLQRAEGTSGGTFNNVSGTVTGTSHTDTGLSPGTYRYRVAATNSVGTGDYSNGLLPALFPSMTLSPPGAPPLRVSKSPSPAKGLIVLTGETARLSK